MLQQLNIALLPVLCNGVFNGYDVVGSSCPKSLSEIEENNAEIVNMISAS